MNFGTGVRNGSSSNVYLSRSSCYIQNVHPTAFIHENDEIWGEDSVRCWSCMQYLNVPYIAEYDTSLLVSVIYV